MSQMTAEQAAEWGKTLNFEKVWAMFAETDRAVAEAGRIVAETSKRLDNVSRNAGGINRSLGELIETLIAARLWEKFPDYGLVCSYQRVPIYDNTNRLRTDIEMKQGNVDRAYRYIRYSLDNINDYNTRIRSSEVLNIQTIIDHAYNQASRRQKDKLQLLLIFISILSLLLTASVCYVYLQMKKRTKIGKQLQESNTELNKLNRKLSDMNNELKKINLEINEANHIKEEYIGYFLDECSNYIEKLDRYRKMVNKRIKDREINELYRITQKNNLKEEELKKLYRNFDEIFMHLFPNFTEDFNALLHDTEQVTFKKGEGLSTEFRIYALMRLGLNDNGKIANFLGYSINTIYNYRTKMKNKARIPKEDFEWTVRRIGGALSGRGTNPSIT